MIEEFCFIGFGLFGGGRLFILYRLFNGVVDGLVNSSMRMVLGVVLE